MRRQFNNLISVVCSIFRMAFYKIINRSDFHADWVERISPNVVLEFNKGSKVTLGKKIRIHSGCKIKVRRGADLVIENNVKINYYCIIACQEKIKIGEGTEFGPSVYLYDHDYKKGLSSNSDEECFKRAPIEIGRNCWIGANTVILRGTKLGDNCVVAAGSVIKGEFPENSVIVQKRVTDVRGQFKVITLKKEMKYVPKANENKLIRILHMIGSLDIGGSQAMVINLYKAVDRSKIQFDFVMDHPSANSLVPIVKELGAKIYTMPTFKGGNIKEIRTAWSTFFIEHPEYKVLHSHVRSYASIYIPIAKKYGVKTIVHSHSTSNGSGFSAVAKMILQYPLRFQADYFFGCSREAGEWLFGKKVVKSNRYHMLQNAIDTNLYIQNVKIREKYRRNLGIEGKRVFLHVGRLHPSKNHNFLLNVFAEVLKKQSDSILLIAGDGELRTEIEEKIKELHLDNSVIMLGSRNDIPNLLQASDCFLFPSKWEGLPVTVVEAQAAGVPCLISDHVTKDVGISELVIYLPIDDGIEVWVNKIQRLDYQKKDVIADIKRAGFDVKTTAKLMENFYRGIVDE